MPPNEMTREQLKINMAFGPSDEVEGPVFVGDKEIVEDYLIVYLDLTINVIFAINLNSTAKMPIQFGYKELLIKIDRQDIFLFEVDWPQSVLCSLDDLPESKQKKAIERYNVIKPLLDNFDAVLRNDYGQECFKEIIKNSGKSKQYIYDCFNGYLRCGQRVGGLSLPIGKNANHVPKKRVQRVKAGRPNKGIAKGKVLNDNDIKNFEKGKRLYAKRNGPSISKTYQDIVRKHYFAERVLNNHYTKEKTGQRFKVKLLPPEQRPTYDQFYYWLCKQYGGNLPLRDKSRQNAIENKKDNAGRTGDARQNIIAPGQVFEIDETPFPEELVSVFDPTRSTKIGKATLYFIIDVFSKLIVGLFITTENPSYNTVRQAIFNSARDKQKWFDELGVDFDVNYWPQSGIASTYLVDKAEFHNKISEGPICDLPVSIKFTRSGRGDDKPNIEQLFHVYQKYFEGVSPAHQTKSQQDIASQLARKHACLTVNELYRITLVYIFFHNNKRVLKSDAREREMIRDKVLPIPASIWKWGTFNRPGYLLNIPDEELYIKLLHKGAVTVHRKGLYLQDKGLWYNCEWTLESGLQERKLPNQRSLTLACRYNPEMVDIVLIMTNEGLKAATLDYKHSCFEGLSFEQVKHQKDKAYTENQLSLEKELEYRLGVQLFIEKQVDNAKAEKISGPVPSLSKIKDNRRFESLVNRTKDLHNYVSSLENYLPWQQEITPPESIREHKAHSAFDED